MTPERHVRIQEIFEAAADLPSRGAQQTSTRFAAATRTCTPPYMAHELFRGEAASPASDRYALSMVAYELLTGSTPFGQRFQIIRDNQRNLPHASSSRNPNLPPVLDAPILAVLNPTPGQRPAHCVAAVAAMEYETPCRLFFAVIGAVTAVLIAGLSAGLRVAQMLEDRTVDVRFAVLPPRPPDRVCSWWFWTTRPWTRTHDVGLPTGTQISPE